MLAVVAASSGSLFGPGTPDRCPALTKASRFPHCTALHRRPIVPNTCRPRQLQLTNKQALRYRPLSIDSPRPSLTRTVICFCSAFAIWKRSARPTRISILPHTYIPWHYTAQTPLTQKSPAMDEAKIKQVLSGDTLVLQNKTATATRTLSLAYVSAPRLRRDPGDEVWLICKSYYTTQYLLLSSLVLLSHENSSASSALAKSSASKSCTPSQASPHANTA